MACWLLPGVDLKHRVSLPVGPGRFICGSLLAQLFKSPCSQSLLCPKASGHWLLTLIFSPKLGHSTGNPLSSDLDLLYGLRKRHPSACLAPVLYHPSLNPLIKPSFWGCMLCLLLQSEPPSHHPGMRSSGREVGVLGRTIHLWPELAESISFYGYPYPPQPSTPACFLSLLGSGGCSGSFSEQQRQ